MTSFPNLFSKQGPSFQFKDYQAVIYTTNLEAKHFFSVRTI